MTWTFLVVLASGIYSGGDLPVQFDAELECKSFAFHVMAEDQSGDTVKYSCHQEPEA